MQAFCERQATQELCDNCERSARLRFLANEMRAGKELSALDKKEMQFLIYKFCFNGKEGANK